MQPIKYTKLDVLGSKNGKWRGGKILTEKGYIRISSGKQRGKYVHRYNIECLLADPVSYMLLSWGGKIPANITVHHMDSKRTHNCTSNLMLLEKAIHDSISKAQAALYNQHCQEQWEEDNEVPF